MENKETASLNTSDTLGFLDSNFDAKMTRFLSGQSTKCKSCGSINRHHRFNCENATRADALHHMDRAVQGEGWAKEKAANMLTECRFLQGKLALVKGELKIARKRNAKNKNLSDSDNALRLLQSSDAQLRRHFGDITTEELRLVRATLILVIGK
jgi:hypothetical protein